MVTGNEMINVKKLVMVSLYSFVSFAYSQDLPECKDLEGKWTGNKVGSGYQGEIIINF
jgi:hypothetical protein